MAPVKTWVLVADAGRARVLEQSGRESTLSLVEGLDLENPIAKTSDTARDSLPRAFDSVGEGRHAIEPRSDPRRAEKKEFALELAGRLDAALEKRAYDRLIIIAPPQMIGDLRPALSDRVRDRLAHELVLDLAHAPITEIAQRLKEAMAA